MCNATASRPKCTVNLGPDPHVHLLELIRRDGSGQVTERVERWVNRPGEEAELPVEVRRRVNGFGAGRGNWLHLLIRFGTTELEEKPRIADAVAASGLERAQGNCGAGIPACTEVVTFANARDRSQDGCATIRDALGDAVRAGSDASAVLDLTPRRVGRASHAYPLRLILLE